MKYSIPKGFDYLMNEDVQKQYEFIGNFINYTKSKFKNFVEFPPLAYPEMYKDNSNIMGDKVYILNDKHHREIVLTPDSQAFMFNYYLQNNINTNFKTVWICPVYRYRNTITGKRFWNQLGLASINHKKEEELNIFLELFLDMIGFVKQQYSKDVKVKIYNLQLIKEIYKTNVDVSEVDFDKHFEEFRICKHKSENDCCTKKECEKFIKIIDKIQKINSKEELKKYLENNEEAVKTLSFLEMLEKHNISYGLDFKKMYSSETLSGLGFEMFIGDIKIGDGGVYDKFGNKFDQKIGTAISICFGQQKEEIFK